MNTLSLELRLPKSSDIEARRQLEAIIAQLKQVIQQISPPTQFDQAVEIAADVCSTTPERVKSKLRDDPAAFARWLVWSHLYRSGHNLSQCGAFCGKGHSTVRSGLRSLDTARTHGKPWQKIAVTEFERRISEIAK